ncbi:MAG: hypothetical protein WAO98_06690 [Alphaproteobacteria bacterium]
MSVMLLHLWQQNRQFTKRSSVCAPLYVPPPFRDKAKPKQIRKKTRHQSWVSFSDPEYADVSLRAASAGLTLPVYIKASALGAGYKPHFSPEFQRTVLALNLELTSQGRQLTKIQNTLRAGSALDDRGLLAVEAIRAPLLDVLKTLKSFLLQNMPQP